MKYSDFERIISPERMRRYLIACHYDTKKAMTLYRYNLKLSQEMFTVISCFEVVLRNKIDQEMKAHFGSDWLRDSILENGIFYSDKNVSKTKDIIAKAYDEMSENGKYTHSKLITEMGFGVWKFMYNNVQYAKTKKCLLKIFPNKPKSTPEIHYNNLYVFNELDRINYIRNRIAHHEPICFGKPLHIDIQYVKNCYHIIIQLFDWMDIDYKKLLYGIDHLNNAFGKIIFFKNKHLNKKNCIFAA